MRLLVICSCLLIGSSSSSVAKKSDGLKIGSFNIQKFGVKKIHNDLNMDVIIKIVLRYDLIFIQEITDKTQTAIKTLLDDVNNLSDDAYELSLSKRVGLEQYAYMYRVGKLQVVKSVVYHDSKDLFAREPYIVVFKTNRLKRMRRFGVIGVHTRPKTARKEIDSLSDVYEYVQHEKWREDDVIIMGDLNADCGYFPKKAKKRNRLYGRGKNKKKRTFMWVIKDDEDTTISRSTDCAYDRFVLAGKNMKKSYVKDSADIFDFQSAYQLTDDEARSVSDHYPIEMQLE
ncbi:DNASE1L3 (predicted) [Pycnogonum litorale]